MGAQLIKPPKTPGGQDQDSSKESLRRRQDKGRDGPRDRNKYRSCPDIGGATPYRQGTADSGKPNNVKVNVKIYRSYGTINEFWQQKMRESHPDVRIYRRSTGNMSEMSSVGSHVSLPPARGQLTRSRSADRSHSTPNGLPRGLELWKMKSASLDRHDRVTTPSTTLSSTSARESFPHQKYASQIPALASVCEFPGVEEVCRKVKLFEESFCHSLVFKFRSLEENVQLCKVSVARCSSHEVALVQYLESPDIPEDLELHHYWLTIPRALYGVLRHLRHTKNGDRKVWRSLAKDIVDGVSFEVGKELSRMYEYQIVMLKEFVAIKLLAAHAADCILEHIIQKHILLDRNSALRGVLNAKPPKPDHGATRFSVILAEREMKWELGDVLKKPAVRKEVGLFEPNTDRSVGSTEMLFSVGWRFYGSRGDCEPIIYGYRGQMLDWDYQNKVYRLHPGEKLYNEERAFTVQDIHQQYMPFHRLVGHEPMFRYLEALNQCTTSAKSFEEFMRQEYGCGGSGEFFVYRPLDTIPTELSWAPAVLENMDMLRLCADEFVCKRIKRSCLVMAEFASAAGVLTVNADECDLSYSTWIGVSADALPQRRCRVAFVALIDHTIPDGFLITDGDGQLLRLPQEIGRRSTLTEQDLRLDISRLGPEADSDLTETRALQLTGAARRVSAERVRDRDSETASTKRKRLKRARLNHSDCSSLSTDFYILDGPAKPQPHQPPHRDGPVPRRSLSQDCYRQLSLGQYSPRKEGTKSQLSFDGSRHLSFDSGRHLSFDSSMIMDSNRLSPSHQPMVYEPRVIVSSGRPVMGESVMRRSSTRSRHRRAHAQPSIDYDSLVQPCHSIKGVPGALLAEKMLPRKPKMYGRQEEVNQLRELISLGERLLIITGCPGIGKSVLAINTLEYLPNNQNLIPVMVDARCCRSAARVLVRVVKQLGVRFQQKNIAMLCSWLAACSERVLLVLDNLDLPVEEDDALSALFNALLKVDKVHIMCTSRRRFYRGDYEVNFLKLEDLGEESLDLLRDLVVDLPDDSLMEVVMACDQVPYTLCLVGQALRLAEDVAALYTTVVSILDGNNEALIWEPVLEGYHGESPERVPRLLAITKAVLDHLSPAARAMLRKLCVFESLFNLTAAGSIVSDEVLQEALETVVDDPRASGLLDQTVDGQHYSLPDLIRLVLPPTETETDRLPAIARAYYVDTLTTLCNKYHSKDSFQALSSMWRDYDNLVDGLISISMSPHLDRKTVQILSSPRMMIFLHDAIAAQDYENFYNNMCTGARELQSAYLESCVYSCQGYHYYMEENFEDAMAYAEQSHTIVPHCENAEQEVAKAFNSLTFGKCRWMLSEDKEQGLSMARQALESFKVLLGIQNPLTIYVYEDYALMEKEIEHYQKARYYYNLIDFVAEDILGLHPGMLRGYDSRREIWERQGLFSRAAGVAQKAAEISAQFYGEHPLTAQMHSRWCECLIKAGDASDAIRAAALALNIREKLLGVHLDTALSNKMFAYLMLRKGHYALALKHGQMAYDMCLQLQAHRKFIKDIEIMLTQAKRRQLHIETAYVKLETHRHSRSLENVLSNDNNLNTINTITTEV